MSVRLPIFLLFLALLALFTPAISCRADTPTPKDDPKIEALIDQFARLGPAVYDDEHFVDFGRLVTSGAPRTVLLENLSTPATYAPSLAGIVRQGAAAVPTLLDHLTDSRPTSVCLEKLSWFGGLYFREEYDPRHGYPDPNWLWPPEGLMSIRAAWKDGAISTVKQGHDTYERYTLRVGDLCYFALGMIVNRQLLATRGVPTGNWVVNSPVYRPALASMARKDWAGVTPIALKQSLIADATSLRSDRRASALERLCYYFPSTGIPLAIRLLHRPLYDDHNVDDFLANVLVQSVGFRDRDIRNWRRVNEFLDSGTTPLARHYQEILSPDSDARDPGREWVPDKLNMLVARPNLYVSSLYKNVPLRPETRRLVQETPKGCQWLYRNRLLLEDVFAGDLLNDPQAPDLSEARLLAACVEFGRRHGWAEEAGVAPELLKLPQRAISDDEDLFPSEPDSVETRAILDTLFPDLDSRSAPMATDAAEDMFIVEDLAPYRSRRIEAAVDRLLRSLSPTAKMDYYTDEFALTCITCLRSTKYGPDCTRFWSKRIAHLKRRAKTDQQDVSYYLPQYRKILRNRAR